jgi:hypothetical protein
MVERDLHWFLYLERRCAVRLAVPSADKRIRPGMLGARAVWIVILCVLVVAGVLPTLRVMAQQEPRYFEETGHNVSGAFLRFYDQHGGLAIFGYPLTRVFSENGRDVQYFQRVRMELHVEGIAGPHIELGMLGQELAYAKPALLASEIPSPEHSERFYFAETGHTVSFAFLDFYRSNGDVDVFGYPITEWVIEPDGRISQYFQRAKMSWYPENAPDTRVQLGMLGTIYVEQNVDPVHKEPEAREISSRAAPVPAVPVVDALQVADLRVRATLERPIIGLQDKQIVYVYVISQDGHGVPGASVALVLQYQDGRMDQVSLEPTNANGYTRLEFEIGSTSLRERVIVKLSARYGDLVAQTSTSFLPSW